MNMKYKVLSALLGACCLSTVPVCGQPKNSEGAPSAENAVIETIYARRSIRRFKPQPVSRQLMKNILDCGINAPNGQNRQSWEVRVVDNPEWDSENIVRRGFFNAPVMVFVANDPTYPFSQIDCGLLCENMMLAAQSLGIGSICVASPVRAIRQSPALLEKLGFSEGYELLICVGFGYADQSPEAKPRDPGKVKFVE